MHQKTKGSTSVSSNTNIEPLELHEDTNEGDFPNCCSNSILFVFFYFRLIVKNFTSYFVLSKEKKFLDLLIE